MERSTKLKYIFSGKAFITYSLLIACMLFTIEGKAQETPLAAIANISGAPAEMKQAQLKAILRGETQRWKNGKRILIALMKTNTPIGKSTSEKIYDMSGDELNKYWLSFVFQGKGQAPVFFTSVSELQNYVAQNPGAIGIIDKPVTTGELRPVVIDGKPSF